MKTILLKSILLLLISDGVVISNVPGKCFNKDRYPTNDKAEWSGTSCYDREGNRYNQYQTILSCCGCLKITCLSSQKSAGPYIQMKSFWNVSSSSSCCQDCHGNVFPIGSAISTIVLDDECGTVVTKKCVAQRRGNRSDGVTSVKSNYKLCCSDSDGLHPIFTSILEKDTCSSRKCGLPEGNLFARWISSIHHPGCNCCLRQGQLVPNGGIVSLANGENATCCEGQLRVPLYEEEGTITTKSAAITTSDTTTTTSTTTISTTKTREALPYNCLEDPLGETKCPVNAACFVDDAGTYSPIGSNFGYCHCFLGFYFNKSTNTCVDMRGGGNCDEKYKANFCYQDKENNAEFCPYCSVHHKDKKLFLGKYVSGEGSYLNEDPQIFSYGTSAKRGRDSCNESWSAEAYWYCWYDAFPEPQVSLDASLIHWSELDTCAYLLYAYTPLACCFTDPTDPCQN